MIGLDVSTNQLSNKSVEVGEMDDLTWNSPIVDCNIY